MTHLAVIHGLRSDSRPTNIQNVLSFSTSLNSRRVTNVNVFGLIPKSASPDVVVLTYDFLALRTWPIWHLLVERVRPLIEASPIRVAFPQDDYTNCEFLDRLFCDVQITHVYSPISADLELLYPRAIRSSIRFVEVLTGYVSDDALLNKVHLSRPFSLRGVDLGQRIRMLDPHLGTRASLKADAAASLAVEAQKQGFRCDVSFDPRDVLLGDHWYQFLGNCRFTVGAKGGASLADPQGKVADRVRRMRLRYPQISREQIQHRLNYRGSREGNFGAISPRIFESAAMGACQILSSDHYFDGFEPWQHYVPLDSIKSIDPRVWNVMRDNDHASEIVRKSQEFLLHSGRYSYRNFYSKFVDEVGITKSKSKTVVIDSSADLDAGAGHDGKALSWLQSYLSRAIARGVLRDVEKALLADEFLQLDEMDSTYADHVDISRSSILSWIDSYRRKELIVESIAIPWRSVSSFLEV